MAVTFSSPASGNVVYLDDVAKPLLRMMGCSGNIPGALMADDVEAALDSLNKELEAQARLAEERAKQIKAQSAIDAEDSDQDEWDKQPAPTLAHRANPLIELLQAAVQAEQFVTWE